MFEFSLVSLKKYFKNTSWMFCGKAIKGVVFIGVTIALARYLGPHRYGLLNYALSLVTIFSALSFFALNKILIRELVKNEKKETEILGTAFFLQMIGAFFAAGFLTLFLWLSSSDKLVIILALLLVFSLFFRSLGVIEYFFQAKVQAKYGVYAEIISVFFLALSSAIFIYFQFGVVSFAVAMSGQWLVMAICLIFVYQRKKLNIFNWKIKLSWVKKLLFDSWPLIIVGAVSMVLMRIDQVMIKLIVGSSAVGNYAVAVRISEIWYFIPIIITGSVFPAIINAKKNNNMLYKDRLQKLYDLMVLLAVVIAIPVSLFSPFLIQFLFGQQYLPAAGALQIYIWSNLFVYLWVANNKYLIAENFTKIALLLAIVGVVANITLNFFLIKKIGILGAAWATLISYLIMVFSVFFIPKTSRQGLFMVKSLNLFRAVKNIKGIREIIFRFNKD
jgi:O-antigen/teichoic acid export membrane protein